MLVQKDNDSALTTLLRRREEVEAWLDGPAKKVTLTALEREIRRTRGIGDGAGDGPGKAATGERRDKAPRQTNVRGVLAASESRASAAPDSRLLDG